MGSQATVVVLCDALHLIREDKEFGKKLAVAISKTSCYQNPADVSSGGYVNAATAIEVHHADWYRCLLLGGNAAKVSDIHIPYTVEDKELTLLKELADKLGYRVSKKPKKNP